MSADIVVTRLPADFERWDELLTLIMRAFAYMDGVIDPPSSAHRLSVDGLREKAGTETGFLAMQDDQIVGCIFAAEHAQHFYVGKLAVEPGLQGRKIGRELMQATEALACAAGKPVLELQARVELTGNQAAFSRLGFVETERTAHAGYNRPTSVTMRKALS
ncbi:MAG TPA: GNAT family N-acetyltransferase [Mesorhizobium sp.]|jgi:predicted N-acetyltransferase YhbS|uniref:GNAT family N-acetyltransferase n=1 Tax=Mesorhizobium sp. TaxID=1871066 RepID=UPI002DDDADD4|nr:GNAT family N-acetyltransferase [Mesorhizobium sp.]HEV2503000.1 GNAT family N-acetyltransferase [Mesorhizobium sp.]